MKLTRILAATLLLGLAISASLAAQEEPPSPNQDEQPLQAGGGGTTNFIPIWTNSTTLGNSTLFESGGMVGIGTTTPAATLEVFGLYGTTNSPTAPTILQVSGGNGVRNVSGVPGSGGPITMTAGAGDSCMTTFRCGGGRGGSIQLTAGSGGSGYYVQGGAGGSITLQPGIGGGTGYFAGAPGNVDLNLPVGGTLDVAAGGLTLADAWTTRSSLRFKTNVRTLDGALETIERLRGVSYDSRTDGKHEIGVIAEEVSRVVPQVVTYEKNGLDAQGVDYGRLTALLIEAVKSQQAEIQQLRSQVELLRSNSAAH
jgi:hypothetical protein